MILEKIWKFLWRDDSIWSWLVSLILAFLIVKFVIYPFLGLILGTGYPIVAVVSGSMEHRPVALCEQNYNNVCISYSKTDFLICGQTFNSSGTLSQKLYWDTCGDWYVDNEISSFQFNEFPFKNGFNKGDVMIIMGKESKDIKVGDVIVFEGGLNYPIIHRVVKVTIEGERYYFQTKGDNNPDTSTREQRIPEEQVLGKAVMRLPLVGWVKIKASEFVARLL